MESTKVSLKLLVDKKTNKVVFAEAGKEFVDLLFYLLSLPIGTVTSLASMVGCVGNLCESLEKMNEAYILPGQNKDSLLKPRIPRAANKVPWLLPATDPQPQFEQKSFYRCGYCSRCFTDSYNTKCSGCNNSMTTDITFVSVKTDSNAADEGYVKGLVTYMVTDDLSVSPMSMIAGVALLKKFNVRDFGALEEREVKIGMDEGLELLKASLRSKAVFTNVFLVKRVVQKK